MKQWYFSAICCAFLVTVARSFVTDDARRWRSTWQWFATIQGSDSSDNRQEDVSNDEDDKVKSPRINIRVRKLMQVLADQLDMPATDTRWKKTRRYLYQTKSLESVRQVENILNTLLNHDNGRLDRDLVREVIQQSPRLLRKNPRTHLQPTLDFLQHLFGPERLTEALQRNPDLLLTRGTGYNGDALELVPVYLQQDLGLTEREIRTLQQKAPRVFETSLSTILTTTHYLLQLLQADENGATANEMTRYKRTLVKIILSYPTLLQLSVERNLKPRVDYLRHRFQLSETDVSTLVKSCNGCILGLSVQDNLAATLDQLEAVLSDGSNDNTSPQKLRQCLLKHPQILGLSLDNLRSKIQYFNHLGPQLAGRLLERAPSVYSLSQDTLHSKIQFLAGVWGCDYHQNKAIHGMNRNINAHVSDPLLGTLLNEYPTILTLSLDGNLRPTVNFYNRTGYTSLDENWQLKDPEQKGFLRGRYLAASLYQRLLPRWHFAQSIASSETDRGEKLQVPLHLLVSGSDAAFCETLGIPIEEYDVFKATTLPRLKFSDQFANWLKTGRPIQV